MKGIFLILAVFSVFSCKDFFRYDIGGNELKGTQISLPDKSSNGASLMGSDVFLVRQNVSLPDKGKVITLTDSISSANFVKKEVPFSSPSKNLVSRSDMINEAENILLDLSARVDPQMYLEGLNLDNSADKPLNSIAPNATTVYSNETKPSSTELDNADFRDVYMRRWDEGSDHGVKYQPINFRHMKVDSDVCRVYYEEELYQRSCAKGDEALIITRAKEVGEYFDKIYNLVPKVMGEPVFKFKDGTEMTDKKINIFIGCLTNGLDDPWDMVLGYFNSKDYSPFVADYYGTGSPNGSNESLCFYIYYNQVVAGKDTPGAEKMAYSTLAHEFTHMLNYGQKIVKQKTSGFPTWLTECFASNMEDAVSSMLFGTSYTPNSPLGSYVDYYLYDKSADSEHVSVGEWTGGFSYNFYYMLGAFMVRNFGGVELIKNVATNQFAEFDAWDHALAKHSSDSEVTDFLTAVSKYPIALITLAGYPDTTPGKYDFCKEASDNFVSFDSFEVLLNDDAYFAKNIQAAGRFPDPYPRYSLPSKTFKPMDFHVEYLGEMTEESAIAYEKLTTGLTYTVVFRTPDGSVEVRDLEEVIFSN